MHLSSILTKCTSVCLALSCLVMRSSAYFVITEPTRQTQWTVGTPNPISWRKGVQDGILFFDVEMARLSQDGLTLVARNVPTSKSSLNILLQDFPTGDDYFLIFMNTTYGVMYATSPRFTVVAPGSASSGKNGPSPVSGVQTVTVSGAPNPTRPFATTFAAVQNGALSRWANAGQAWALGSALIGCLVGAAWTFR